jgi:hypothetical protein
MDYEESIGLVTGKMFFYCRFSRFRTFYGLKHDLSEKKMFRLSRAGVICATPTASPLKDRKLKFWLSESFGPT